MNLKRMRYVITLGLIILLLALWISCHGRQPRVLAMANVEQQLLSQLHDSDISPMPKKLHVLGVRPVTGGFIMTFELNLGRNKASSYDVVFAPVSARYAMGTLNAPEFGPPVPLILHFPD